MSYTCLDFCSSLKIGIVNILFTTSNEAVCTLFSCTSIFSVASNFASCDLFVIVFLFIIYTYAILKHSKSQALKVTYLLGFRNNFENKTRTYVFLFNSYEYWLVFTSWNVRSCESSYIVVLLFCLYRIAF